MLFSNALKCGNSKSSMKIDEACLNIQSESDWSLGIFGQSQECERCPLFELTSILPKQNESLIVNTKYPTILQVRTDENILCNSTFTFEEHGGYYWNISNNCSKIFEKYEADVAYLPILESIIIFFCFATVWYVTKSLYKRSNPTTSWADLFRFRHISRVSDCTTALLDSQPSTKHPRRLRSIDTFRGISVVLMIFVNYGGGNYWFFEHSIWNGLTIADIVFPMFLWIMGFCLHVSLRARLSRDTNKMKMFKHIVKRSLILVIVGIMLNSVKAKNLDELRFPGVLQRIGITFFIAGTFQLLISNLSDKIKNLLEFTSWVLIVILYLTITFALPVPGCPKGYLGPGGLHENNSFALCTGGSAGYIDRLVFSKHIYKYSSFHKIYETTQEFDPEGLLSTLTSVLTVQLGFNDAYYLFDEQNVTKRLWKWITFGIFRIIFGGFFCGFTKNGGWQPINKNLWSLSYLFITAGISIMVFSFLHYITDVKKKWFGRPFYYVGMNALFVYIGHILTSKMFPFYWPPVYESHREILFMNLTGTVLWILIAIYMYKANIFITL